MQSNEMGNRQYIKYMNHSKGKATIKDIHAGLQDTDTACGSRQQGTHTSFSYLKNVQISCKYVWFYKIALLDTDSCKVLVMHFLLNLCMRWGCHGGLSGLRCEPRNCNIPGLNWARNLYCMFDSAASFSKFEDMQNAICRDNFLSS